MHIAGHAAFVRLPVNEPPRRFDPVRVKKCVKCAISWASIQESAAGPFCGSEIQVKGNCAAVQRTKPGRRRAARSMNPPPVPGSERPVLSPGVRFGVYEILQRLGAGGMGEVYRARDTRLEREVAIKTLTREFSSQRDALARFEREARSACALNHPNIVTIYELGDANGVPYIAMELVQGETLRELLASGPMPFRKTVAIAAQIADALAKAHEIGIVHRDLKPENLMVSDDVAVKILDFGLAKLRPPNPDSDLSLTAALTEHGVVMGTSGYMSPEQSTGKNVDFRSDQFSFGSVLYEMITGLPAFKKKTHAETTAAILRDEPDRKRDASARPVPLDYRALPREGSAATLCLYQRFSQRSLRRPRPAGRDSFASRRPPPQ